MKKRCYILSIFILLNLNNFGQSPITYTINITSMPTCSTCCDGQACVTPPSGGACAGVYQIVWSNAQTGSCANGFCSNTTYTVKVFDSPCSDSTIKTFTMPPFTGIFEYTKNFTIKVFPNPVSNTIFISAEQTEFESSEIEITNCLGQIILILPFQNQVDVSDLTSGYYSIKIITSSKQEYYSKFIKNEN